MDVVLQAICSDENDEIILIEPFYSHYLCHAQLSRGTVKTVPLVLGEDDEWHLNLDILKSTLNEKTKAFIMNTPHNPTGKVFTLEELTEISDILEEFPHVYVLSDDVYSLLTFDDAQHHIFANIGQNWHKTITIFSGSKLLCCSGWRIGW